jgi:hypothetical protein
MFNGIRETTMKTAMTSVLLLSLAAMVGCQSSSPRGGSVLTGEGFKIAAPVFATEIKQGETQSVPVTLERGKYFKQDVKLQIETSAGLSVDPTSVIIKASDNPALQLRIAAAQNAALGEYRVSVRGVPKTGEPTSTVFSGKVVAP